MSASWIQDRRRKQAAGYDEKTGAALADIMGGLEASLAVPETERKRKLAEEQAAEGLGVRKTAAEAALIRAKTADEAAKESLIRKKGESDAKATAAKEKSDREETVLRKKESSDVLRSRVMAGDEFKPDVPTIDDEALGGLDDTSFEAVRNEATAAKSAKETADAEKKRKTDADIEATEALADARTADAEKKRRAPTGGKGAKAPRPLSPDAARKLKAEADKAEADAKKAARDAAGDGKPVKPLLTPGEVTSVTELQQGQDILKRLSTLKTTGGKNGAPIDTGPFAQVGDWFAKNLDMEDDKKTEFKALAGENVASYIKSISGATVSEPERKNLLENVPTAGDHDDRFMAKLKMIKDTLDAKLRIQKKAFAATGRDTTIFDVPDDVGAVPPAKKPADMSDADIEARLKELKAKR